jgi:glycosyltransferase involved in cell wall biosynthesis
MFDGILPLENVEGEFAKNDPGAVDPGRSDVAGAGRCADMKRDWVSVIIPVKDGERFLAGAIESVLRQTYQPIEVVVVDGHSVDGSARIAQAFDSVRYLLQIGTGLWSAYNQGIEASQGEFIAFLSSDDWWEPEKVALQVACFREQPEIEYTVTRARFVAMEDDPPGASFRKNLLGEDYEACMPETLMVRRTLFEKVGKFDTGFCLCADVAWFAEVRSLQVPMKIIPKVLVGRRIGTNNLSVRADLGAASNRELIRIMKRAIDRRKSQVTAPEQEGDRHERS